MIKYIPQWFRNKTMGNILPLELILFITGRCNFRCKHCFIDKFTKKASDDISLENIKRIAQSLPNLMVLMLTGGEPFLRDDVPEIVKVFSDSSKPEAISFVTNGFYTDKIERTIKEILSDKNFQSTLVINISFDGIGKDHDKIRGCKGAYDKAIDTAQRLSYLSKKDSRLSTSANLTLIPGKEDNAITTMRELAKLGVFGSINQNYYRETRPRQAALNVNLDAYRTISKTVRKYDDENGKGSSLIAKWIDIKKLYLYYLIEKTCRENSYQGIPCEAGRNIGVIEADGSVYPCEMIRDSWGNINNDRLQDIWNHRSNRQKVSQLRSTQCFCTHECFLSASINMQFVPLFKMLSWSLKTKLFTAKSQGFTTGP